jgi:hypothetical protein
MTQSKVNMKLLLKLFIPIIFITLGCKDDIENVNTVIPSTKGILGFVQKGPFVSGSNITIQVLDSLFNPTGQSYTVTTIDDFGSFDLQSEVKGSYIEIIAQGYYFNEVAGLISNSALTLRAISSVKEDLKSNVNVLTTLSKNRIIYLVKNEDKKFAEAKKQAETEILDLFNIPYEDSYDFNLMDIRKDGDENAILLAISSILQGGLSVGELSELLSKIILDIEKDGVIDTNTLVQTIYNNALSLKLSSIRTNLMSRYNALGIQHPIPSFELYAKKLIPLIVKNTVPSNFESQVRFDLDKISVSFNKEIKQTSISSDNFIVTIPNGEKVAGSFNYVADSFRIEFNPTSELLPEVKYKIQILSDLEATDGDKLLGGHSFEFNTVNIDINSNLLALYLLNGNALDESGNNQHGNGVNVQFGADINGNIGSACTFSGEGTYLELPNVLNMTELVWTYSIWFKLDDLPSGTAPVLLGTRLSANAFWDIPLYIRSSIKAIATYNGAVSGISDVISLNTWYHVVLVIDNGVITMYLNGQLKSSKTDFWSGQNNSGYEDFLGNSIGSYEFYTGKYYISERFRGESFPSYMKGSVDNIRFYRRALNKFEVKKLFDDKI